MSNEAIHGKQPLLSEEARELPALKSCVRAKVKYFEGKVKYFEGELTYFADTVVWEWT